MVHHDPNMGGILEAAIDKDRPVLEDAQGGVRPRPFPLPAHPDPPARSWAIRALALEVATAWWAGRSGTRGDSFR